MLTARGSISAHDATNQIFVRDTATVVEAIRVDAARAMPRVLGVFTGPDLRDDGVGPIPALLAERSGGTRNSITLRR